MNIFLIKLAWKNLWRNKRRTYLTVGAIAFSVTALTWVFNYYDTFHEQLIQNAIRFQSGHLVVTQSGFLAGKSPSLYIKDGVAVERGVEKQLHTQAISSRVIVQGLLSSAYGSTNVIIHGVTPERERRTTHFADNMVTGTFFGSGRKCQNAKTCHPVVIGSGLAKFLKAKVGSKLVVLTQGIDGSVGNELLQVVGIFDTQSDQDRVLAFTTIEVARSLLSLPNQAVHQVSILLNRSTHLEKDKELLRRLPELSHCEVSTWQDLQKSLMAILDLNKSANRILMAIILFVACLGIANSILMGIMERTREFGVMAALGTSRGDRVRMVVFETLLTAIVGTFLGCVMGYLLTAYFGKHGFDLRWFTSQEVRVNGALVETMSYPRANFLNFVFVSVTVLLMSSLASLLPARYVARMKILEALK